MDSEDVWGEDDSNQIENQRKIAENDFNKLEQDMLEMGFREGIIDESDNHQKQVYMKGLNDAFEEHQIVGYAKGKALLIQSLLQKFELNLDQQYKDILQNLQNEGKMKQQNEKDVDQMSDQILENIFQQKQQLQK